MSGTGATREFYWSLRLLQGQGGDGSLARMGIKRGQHIILPSPSCTGCHGRGVGVVVGSCDGAAARVGGEAPRSVAEVAWWSVVGWLTRSAIMLQLVVNWVSAVASDCDCTACSVVGGEWRGQVQEHARYGRV